ncbi:aminodeoxychorismate/anthranilate synthase component II [Psychromonas antarctica]|uniref:aminodeoxychorismate/anthranilate synthase component II n=1 Tax=Psychromonas antarctica TaxID=67573 RepID=UPI001EE8D4A2|nr:aminodeoxychorismate/anthranilate synthase component II [Psychromonas antarctica]MCG6200312.1 aminodeoxychorismate/anthranilate synthase component II [Psychromonas antarctica]
MNITKKPTLFFLDNFDSFTYNLVDQFKSLDYPVKIYRNSLSAQQVKAHIDECENAAVLILSPGPGTPSAAGCMIELIGLCKGQLPIIGICLGHQALIEQYGGVVGQADEIMHGKSSLISHCGDRMFAGLSQPLSVARYHSLIGIKVPDSLETVADYNGMCMAVYNAQDKVIGFQFHPESILTCEGAKLLESSLNLVTNREAM